MIFDRFVKAVENHLTNATSIIDTIQEVNLYSFPGSPAEAVKEMSTWDEEYTRKICSDFRLPSPCVSIEKITECVILKDMAEDQQGVSPRGYIHVSSIQADADTMEDGELFTDDPKQKMKIALEANIAEMGDILFITAGVIQTVGMLGKEIGIIASKDYRVGISTKKGVIMSHEEITNMPNSASVDAKVTSTINDALREFMYYNREDRYIIEKAPGKVRKDPKKLLRSPDRSEFILLTEKQALARFPEEFSLDKVKDRHLLV